MREPIVIEPVLMKDVGDCALCCLAMLLGKTYAEVLVKCPRRTKTAVGLSGRQIANVAIRLGARLAYHDLPEEDEVGILMLERGADDSHAVLYLKGVLYHPGDGTIWTDVEAFLREYKWTIHGFFWREK